MEVDEGFLLFFQLVHEILHATWLAIQGVHVEHDIVDAVHGIDGGWLVAVTDGVGKLLCAGFVVITSLAHQRVDEETLLKDVQGIKLYKVKRGFLLLAFRKSCIAKS